jgi:hypothetical protein
LKAVRYNDDPIEVQSDTKKWELLKNPTNKKSKKKKIIDRN